MPAKKIGLALGGGAALGWSHIGVIHALHRHGIRPDIISGTSMGSVVGACLAADKLEHLEVIARDVSWKSVLSFADIQFGKNGLLGGEKIVRELENQFAEMSIEQLPVPFATLAVDLISGEPHVFTEGSVIDAVRASISLPGIFTPHKHNGMLLVDGGLAETVPISLCRQLGADIVIGVDVVADYRGQAVATGLIVEDQDKEISGIGIAQKKGIKGVWYGLRNRTAKLFRRRRREPGLLGIGIASGALIMRQLAKAQQEAHPPELMIEPKVGHIMQIEFHKADELIRIGDDTVENMISVIQNVLSTQGNDTQAERSEMTVQST